MLYLCERYDKDHKLCYEYDTDDYWEVMEWLIWMQSGLGPMQVRQPIIVFHHPIHPHDLSVSGLTIQQGQANHFYRYAPEKIEYGIKRYQTKTKRLYQVLEDRLQDQKAGVKSSSDDSGPWIVGDKMAIADLANFAWINWAEWAGIDVAPIKLVKGWLDRINSRPAIQKGLDVPEPFEMKKKMQTKYVLLASGPLYEIILTAFYREGEEEYAKMHSNWVMKGEKEDAEKHQ